MNLIFLCLLLKKVALPFCPGEARETSWTFSRTYNKILGLLRTAKNPGLFQDVATLLTTSLNSEVNSGNV